MGLDGMILVAFLLGLPANEIVLPVAFMGYTGASAMVDAGDIAEMAAVLRVNGWTWVTALCTVLFSLLHFPCATTLLTIFKETGRARWAIATALITTATAAVACFLARAALTGSFSPF
jgi:ferrous iron transport protein B